MTDTTDTTDPVLVLDLDVGTRDELFAAVAGRLRERGWVAPTFLDAVTAREAKFPTGLDFGKFAVGIPHTDPEHVVHPGVVVCRTPHPVAVNAMDKHDRELDVRLSIWPLVVDASKQVTFLATMLKLLQRDGVYQSLLEDDADSVASLITESGI